MIYLLAGMLVSFIGIGVFGTLATRARYNSGDGWALGTITSILAAVLFGIFTLVLVIGRPVGRSTCANWSRQTGITTKFVLLNQFDMGTCLARTPGGTWVQNTEWKAFVNGNK